MSFDLVLFATFFEFDLLTTVLTGLLTLDTLEALLGSSEKERIAKLEKITYHSFLYSLEKVLSSCFLATEEVATVDESP